MISKSRTGLSVFTVKKSIRILLPLKHTTSILFLLMTSTVSHFPQQSIWRSYLEQLRLFPWRSHTTILKQTNVTSSMLSVVNLWFYEMRTSCLPVHTRRDTSVANLCWTVTMNLTQTWQHLPLPKVCVCFCLPPFLHFSNSHKLDPDQYFRLWCFPFPFSCPLLLCSSFMYF